MEFNIESIVNEYITKEDKERKIGVYYPSELGFCIRRNFYLYKNPKPIDVETKRVFAIGNIFHEFIANALKNKGFKLHEVERSFSIVDSDNDLVVSGRLDHLIVVDNETEPFILEVKTTKSIRSLREAKYEHVMQVMPYMRANNVNKTLFVYIEKESLAIKSFWVEYDNDKFKELMTRAKRLHNCLTNNVFPPAESKEDMSKGWMCLYCTYKNMCR